MIGQGDLVIAHHFQHHRIPFCRCNNLPQHYDAFLKDTGIKCSSKPSYGSLAVTGTSKVARKPGQRKRLRAERAAPKKLVMHERWSL